MRFAEAAKTCCEIATRRAAEAVRAHQPRSQLDRTGFVAAPVAQECLDQPARRDVGVGW